MSSRSEVNHFEALQIVTISGKSAVERVVMLDDPCWLTGGGAFPVRR